jgi:hypothetical protein
VREERQKLRRVERTAKQLGLTAEEVSNDERLRRQVLEAAPVDDSGTLDPRLQYAKGPRTAGFAASGDAADEAGGSAASLYAGELFGGLTAAGGRGFNAANVRREMELQERMAAEGGGEDAGKKGFALGSMDEDDEAPKPAAAAGITATAPAAAGPRRHGGFDIDDLL